MTIKFRTKTIPGFTVDSPLQPFWFPGGEAHIKGVDNTQEFQYQLADVRGATPADLIMLSMWGQAVAERNEKAIVLLPYLPAARADRGVPNLHSYTSLIADSLPDQIVYLDPHSPAWVDDYINMDDIAKLTEFPVSDIIQREIQNGQRDSGPHPYVGVIAPDKGAHDRAKAAGIAMGIPVYTAGKTRDFETGQLTGFHMEDKLPEEGKFLIVDDICDGGGTFNGLADAIWTTNPDVTLDLWVTHGIFSKGFDQLKQRFGQIHTTDSWNADLKSLPDEHLTVHPVLPYLTIAIDA